MADHYETLGVPPAATDREIKKAYFALVRQFPPETHADDFRRIREAYEALSNPEARAEHDRARAAGGEVEPFSEHGPELGSQLRAAAAALNADRPKEAIPILEAAVTSNPDVIVARDMLGVAMMMDGDMRNASQVFEELVRRDPNNPVFRVRLGHTYRDLKFDRPALASYLKARELAPNELAIRFVLSDFYVSRRQWKEALDELDQAAGLAAGRSEKDWEPALRRVGVQLARKKMALVKRELGALLAGIPAEDEVRKYIADRLASMAARAFALQRPRDGNYLLDVARSLRPERSLGSFPLRISAPLDRLPEATRQWLREQPEREIVKRLWSRGYSVPGVTASLGLLTLAIGGLTAAGSVHAVQAWGAGAWTWLAVLLGLGGWLLAAGALGLRRARRSPLGKFTTLHQHYLVQVNQDQVTFWPLINLVRVSAMHHQTYAGSTTSVRMKFGWRTAALSIRDREVATGLANGAANNRGRLLDLLSSGLLEADGELDVLPRELRERARPSAVVARRLRGVQWQAAGAAAAAAVVLALPPFQARGVDDNDWELARNSAHNARGYLDAHPDGRHAAEARAALDEELERGLHRLQQMHSAQSAVLGELIEALRRAGTNVVQVTYAPSVRVGRFRVPPSLAMADVALADRENLTRHGRITTMLQHRIDSLVGPTVVELRDGIGTSRAESPVKLEVTSVLGLSGEVYRLSDDAERAYFGLVLRSGVDVRLGQGDAPAHHYDLEAGPQHEVAWNGEAATPRHAYAKMADAAADALGQELVAAMQMGE